MAPRPVNVLASSDFTTVAELASLGVRRISVGGALARAAWAGFFEAAREIAAQGTFISLSRAGALERAERTAWFGVGSHDPPFDRRTAGRPG